MWYVYILKSINKDWFYVGHTADKISRLKYHNNKKVRSTKPYSPFIIVYSEKFDTKGDAFKREQQIKSYRHGEAFKKLVA